MTDPRRQAHLDRHAFEGIAYGTPDRPCTRCGRADRHAIHYWPSVDPMQLVEADRPLILDAPPRRPYQASGAAFVVLAFLAAVAIAVLIFLASLSPGPSTRPGAPDLASDRTRVGADRARPGASSAGEALPLPPSSSPFGGGGWEPDAVSGGDGVASWYCCTRGYAGTAVVAIPGAEYVPVGRPAWGRANVCVLDGEREVCGTFPIVDACGCPDPRIVDLSIEAVHELGLDPDDGLWPARITVVRGDGIESVTIPPTDIQP